MNRIHSKFLTSVFLIATIPIASVVALAGQAVGNGGGAWVCRAGPDDAIVSVQLLDLYEAVMDHKLTVLTSNADLDTQISDAISRLAVYEPDLATNVAREVRLIRTQIVPIGGGYRLPPPTDTRLRFLREEYGCYLEGLALYDDEAQVLQLDMKLFNSPLFSTTQKAALFVHEGLYKVFRQHRRVDSSVLARKAIAYLFSEQGLHPRPVDEALDRAHYYCASVEPDFDSLRKIPIFKTRKHARLENAFLDHFTKVKEIGRSEFYVTQRTDGGAMIQVTRWDRRDFRYLNRAEILPSHVLVDWVRDGFPAYTGKKIPAGYPPQRIPHAVQIGVAEWVFSEFFPAFWFRVEIETYYSPYPLNKINRDHFGSISVSGDEIPVVCIDNGPNAKERLATKVAGWLAK